MFEYMPVRVIVSLHDRHFKKGRDTFANLEFHAIAPENPAPSQSSFVARLTRDQCRNRVGPHHQSQPSCRHGGRSRLHTSVNGFDYDNTDELIWNTQTLARCAPVRVAPCFALISSTRMEIAVPASFVATPGTVTVSLRGFN